MVGTSVCLFSILISASKESWNGQKCCFRSHFSWVDIKKSKAFSTYTTGIFLSNFVHKVVKSVSVHTSPLIRRSAKIIHPPDRCGISRCWLNGMISTQVCLGLVTIKGHSKMCSFITQHNATDVAGFEGACNWHAQGQGLDTGEDDALHWRVCDSVFQLPPISSNFAQPLKRSGSTFHRPQSTLCKRDVLHCMRQMVVTPDTDISDPWDPPR